MRAGSTTRFVGIVVGGGSPSPQPQFSDKIACNMQKTLARAPRFGHGPSQDAARCRSRQARGTSLVNGRNRGLLTEETMTAHVAAVAPIATAKSSSVRWKIFLLMLFLISINYIDRASLSVAMPLICEGVQSGPRDAGTDPELVLLDLRLHAGAGRHAGRSVQAAHRHRVGDARLGLLPGDRRCRNELGRACADPAGAGRVGGADLPRRRQAQRDLDDAERARPRRDAARRRRAARRGARIDRDRLADRRLRLMAHGLRRCRRRHDDLRPLGLVVHPQHAARASLRQRGRSALHRTRRTRCEDAARRRVVGTAAGPAISAIVRSGACAWAGCSSTPSSTAC